VGDEICIPLVPQYIKPPAEGEVNPFEHLMIYVIQAGDTLQSILDRFGLSWEDFLRYNKTGNMMLQPGSTLQIPQRSMDRMEREMETRQNDMMRQNGEVAEEMVGVIEPEEE